MMAKNKECSLEEIVNILSAREYYTDIFKETILNAVITAKRELDYGIIRRSQIKKLDKHIRTYLL